MNEDKIENKKPGILSLVFAFILLVIFTIIFWVGMRYSFFSLLGIATFGLFFISYVIAVVIHFTKLRRFQKRYIIICLILFDLLLFFLIFHFFTPDHDRWRTYTFENELAEIESRRAVSDSENAAILYESLFSKIDLKTCQPVFFMNSSLLTPNKFWKESEYPQMKEWLNEHKDMLTDITKICQMKKCRFPIQTDPFERLKPDYLNRIEKMIFLSKVIVLSANMDFGKENLESGINKYLFLMQMADHCYQQPSILDFCLGFSLEQKALRLIYKVIVKEDIKDEQLKLIKEAVNIQDNWGKDWLNLMEVRKLEEKNICCAAYEINHKGKIRFNRNALTYLNDQKSSYFGKYYRNRLLSVFFPFFFPYSPETVSKIIDKAYDNYNVEGYPKLEVKKLIEFELKKYKEFKRLKSLKLVMQWLSIDVLQVINIHYSHREALARRRVCSLLLGLRLYKNKNNGWPQGFDDIKSFVASESFIDPINQGEFIYKIIDNDFTLYSAGKNKIDENGISDCGDGENNGADDILFWPNNHP